MQIVVLLLFLIHLLSWQAAITGLVVTLAAMLQCIPWSYAVAEAAGSCHMASCDATCHAAMQIVVLMLFLSHLLSWQAAVTGLVVTLAVMPLSMWVGKWQGELRSKVVECTDARVKLTSEVLTGMIGQKVRCDRLQHTNAKVKLTVKSS